MTHFFPPVLLGTGCNTVVRSFSCATLLQILINLAKRKSRRANRHQSFFLGRLVFFSLARQTLAIGIIILRVVTCIVHRFCWVWRMHFRLVIRLRDEWSAVQGRKGKEDASGTRPKYYMRVNRSVTLISTPSNCIGSCGRLQELCMHRK
ncbi:hypothetical protein K439DRAFT_1195938 [Ramaria rubella]|nr:hypothetical protein K439DRAFT_1195938 [Ramaria rubella]